MYNELIKKLKEEKKVVNIGLFTHKNPDYDAVCSTHTLANYLKKELKDKANIYPILDKHDYLKLNINTTLPSYDTVDTKLDYAIVLDVNEKDRLYGLSLFDKTNKDNRYLYDHHTGNREELDILDKQKIVLSTSSSTCEVLGLDLLETNFNLANALNLYTGIISDTAGLTRQVGDLTNKLIKLLNINEETKKTVYNMVIDLSDNIKELYERITEEESNFDNLKLYKLKLDITEEEKIRELKNKFIEEKITPNDLNLISILFIECGSNVFLKIRKNENSNLDILTLAEKCNGGGHSNRCAGRFFNTSYNEVLTYVNDLFYQLAETKKYTR